MRAAPDRRPPPTAQHAPPPRTSTSHPPYRQEAVHIEHLYKRPALLEPRTQPATGIDQRTPTTRCHNAWASSGRRTQTSARESPPVAGHPQKRVQRSRPGTGKGAIACSGPPPQPPTPRPPPTTIGWLKGRCPVFSNRSLHRAMQQRCLHTSASARSPSSPPMPRPRLQRAATARQEKIQLYTAFADCNFGWTSDLRAPPDIIRRATDDPLEGLSPHHLSDRYLFCVLSRSHTLMYLSFTR
jgi:hypothetical protein